MRRVIAAIIAWIMILAPAGCGEVKNTFLVQIGILENGELVETGTGNDVGIYHEGMKLAILPLDDKENPMSLDGALSDSKGILEISFNDELGMFVAEVVKGGKTNLSYMLGDKTYEGVTLTSDNQGVGEDDSADAASESSEEPFSILLYVIDNDNIQECGFGNNMGVFQQGMTLGVIPCDNETREPLDFSGELYCDDEQIAFRYDDSLGMFVGGIEKNVSAELFYRLSDTLYSGTIIEIQ